MGKVVQTLINTEETGYRKMKQGVEEPLNLVVRRFDKGRGRNSMEIRGDKKFFRRCKKGIEKNKKKVYAFFLSFSISFLTEFINSYNIFFISIIIESNPFKSSMKI